MFKSLEEDTLNKKMKPGDVIWQSRSPGGTSLLIEIWDDREEYEIQQREAYSLSSSIIWSKHDFPLLRVLHPTEGLITDPSYYYSTLDEAEKYGRRRLRYELEQAGEEVPIWLLKEIAEDESR